MRLATYRKVPISTKCSILFGGFKNQFGWAFLGFGLIFFWGFAMNSDWSFLHFKGEIITIEGTAIRSVDTDASEGEVPVFENHFKFMTADGLEFEGISYATGQRVLSGETLIIEYPEGKPQYARIKGMRSQTFGTFVIFVVIFPLTGLIFILLGLKRSTRALRLFKYGELTKGVLVSKKRTNTKVNGQVVYKLTFRYTDYQGKEYEHREKTFLPYLLEDQREERMLYLVRKPAFAIMLDSLPSSALFNADGSIGFYPPVRLIFIMFFPLLTIVGHGIYVLNTYVG